MRFLGMHAKNEVYGLFMHTMGNQGLQQMFTSHQGLIPDIGIEDVLDDSLLRVFLQDGKTEPILGELKTLSASTNNYPVRADGKTGVQLRADKIATEYLRKARQADAAWNGTPRGVEGPVELELKKHGLMALVVGHYGEWSSDLQFLCRAVASDTASDNCQKFGCYSENSARSVIANWLKRRWGRRAIRWKSQIILRSLAYVGGTAQAQAASRRFRAEAQETQWEASNQRWNRDEAEAG